MQAQDLINAVAEANLAPIELSQAVRDRASSQDVKDFAQREIEDHRKLNGLLMAMAQRRGMNLANKLSPRLIETKKSWEGLSGHELDRRYMAEMVAEHAKAISLFEQAMEQGESSDLQMFARNNLPMWHEHLTNARALAARLEKAQSC